MLSKDILEKDTYNILTPITCKYCSHYNTYIEFDLELHLYEIHSIRSDYTIKDAIDSGKRLGRQLDEDSIQKLDLEYLGEKTSPKATAYEDIGKVRPWSQRAKKFLHFHAYHLSR